MPGPNPKPPGQRQRRNRTTVAASFEAPPAIKPELPERTSFYRCVYPGCPLTGLAHNAERFAKAEIEPHDFEGVPVPWHPLARGWWDVVWASPMAREEWIDADVPNLLMLVSLVDDYWRFGDKGVAAEVRQQSREFGISPMSRRTLQWEIKRLEAVTAKPEPTKPRARTSRAKSNVLSILDAPSKRLSG